MRYLLISILLLCLSSISCSIKATRGIDKQGNEWLRLDGLGAESAKWKDGAEIHKRESVRIPDLMPTNK